MQTEDGDRDEASNAPCAGLKPVDLDEETNAATDYDESPGADRSR